MPSNHRSLASIPDDAEYCTVGTVWDFVEFPSWVGCGFGGNGMGWDGMAWLGFGLERGSEISYDDDVDGWGV